MTSEWAIHRDNLVVVAASPPHSPRGGAGVAEGAEGAGRAGSAVVVVGSGSGASPPGQLELASTGSGTSAV